MPNSEDRSSAIVTESSSPPTALDNSNSTRSNVHATDHTGSNVSKAMSSPTSIPTNPVTNEVALSAEEEETSADQQDSIENSDNPPPQQKKNITTTATSKYHYTLDFLYSLRHHAASTAPLESGSQLCQLMKWSSVRRNFNEDKVPNHSNGSVGGNSNTFLNAGNRMGRLDMTRFGSADEMAMFDGIRGGGSSSGPSPNEFQSVTDNTSAGVLTSGGNGNPTATSGNTVAIGSLLGHPTQFRPGNIGVTTTGGENTSPQQLVQQINAPKSEDYLVSSPMSSPAVPDGLISPVPPPPIVPASLIPTQNKQQGPPNASRTPPLSSMDSRPRDFGGNKIIPPQNQSLNQFGWTGGGGAGGRHPPPPLQQSPQPQAAPLPIQSQGPRVNNSGKNGGGGGGQGWNPPGMKRLNGSDVGEGMLGGGSSLGSFRNSVAATAAANGGPFFASRFVGSGNGNMSPERLNNGHQAIFDGMYDQRGEFMNEGMLRNGNSMMMGNGIDCGNNNNSWDQDLWDSPIEGADTGDIFTLGDIRRAERMIESQGITADMYADLETRRILKDQQQQKIATTSQGKLPNTNNNNNNNRQGIDPLMGHHTPSGKHSSSQGGNGGGNGLASQDIFFGDDSVPGYGRESSPFSNQSRQTYGTGSESRFISMFNKQPDYYSQPNSHFAGNSQNAYQRQDFPSNTDGNGYSMGSEPPPNRNGGGLMSRSNSNLNSERVIDKAIVREHLLRLIGGGGINPGSPSNGRDGGIESNMGPVRAGGGMPTSGHHHAGNHPRGPLTFSKPMNPAAPNFAPSGLYNTYGGTVQQQAVESRNVPPPPPPSDYRRGISATDNNGSQPPTNWLRREMSQPSQPSLQYLIGNTNDQQQQAQQNNNHANLGPTNVDSLAEIGTNELYDLLQRWVARQQQQQQQSATVGTASQGLSQGNNTQPNAVMDANLAVQALIQKHSAATAYQNSNGAQQGGTNKQQPSDALLARYNSLIMNYLKRTKAGMPMTTADPTASQMNRPKQQQQQLPQSQPPPPPPPPGTGPTGQSTAAPISTSAIAQQVAAIQALLQQQISRQQQQQSGSGNGGPNNLGEPGLGASQKQQLAFLLQTLQKLKSNQSATAALSNSSGLSTTGGGNFPQPSTAPRQQQPIFLSNALEQITSKHQANVGNAVVGGAHQQSSHLLQRQSVAKPTPVSNKRANPSRQSSVTDGPMGGVLPASFGPPPGIPQDMLSGRMHQQLHQSNNDPALIPSQQQQQMNHNKSLDAARAQLSALLKDMVAQGGGPQALSVLLKKTPPGHAQAIQAQIQALIQQKTVASDASHRAANHAKVDDAETEASTEIFMRSNRTQQGLNQGRAMAGDDKENFYRDSESPLPLQKALSYIGDEKAATENHVQVDCNGTISSGGECKHSPRNKSSAVTVEDSTGIPSQMESGDTCVQ